MLDGLRSLKIDCFGTEGRVLQCSPAFKRPAQLWEFCERFLLEEKVAVIPGGAFGDSGEGFVRMCYAVVGGEYRPGPGAVGRFLNRL